MHDRILDGAFYTLVAALFGCIGVLFYQLIRILIDPGPVSSGKSYYDFPRYERTIWNKENFRYAETSTENEKAC